MQRQTAAGHAVAVQPRLSLWPVPADPASNRKGPANGISQDIHAAQDLVRFPPAQTVRLSKVEGG